MKPQDQKNKPPILFIHGMCHGGWCWEVYFVPYFSKLGYSCQAINLSGHDQNKPINQISLSDYVRDVEAAVSRLDRPPVIIGHSMGGLVLQKYLERNSCEKAVFLASVPPAGVFWPTLRFIASHPLSIRHLIRLDIRQAFYEHARAALYSPGLDETVLVAYRSQLRPESFYAYLQMMWPSVKTTKAPDIPILILGAENDQLIRPEELQQMAERYQTKAIILKDIAHNMMLDTNHQKVAETIYRWLEHP